MSDDRIPARLLVTLAFLSATAPVASDLYLASFPQMAHGLHTSASLVQMTLTAFLVGIGIGQMLWGPITDRFGRRRPMLLGGGVALVASLVSTFAPDIDVLIGARLIQALFGAAVVTAGGASIADRLSGFPLARTLTLLGTIIGVAPIIAPAAGGLLAETIPWRGVLGVIAGFTALQIVLILVMIRESLPPEKRSTRVRYGHIATLLRRPAYVGHAATQLFSFATLMTYVSSSSFVFERYLGFSSAHYGLCFALNACGLMAGNFVSSRFARRHIHPARTIARALPLAAGAIAVMVAVVLSPVPHVLLTVPLFVAVFAIGLIGGNSGALAVQQARDVAGSGSGLNGGMMFLGAGLISPLGGIAGEDTATPMALTMACTILCSAACFIAARRYVARHPHVEHAFAVAPTPAVSSSTA